MSECYLSMNEWKQYISILLRPHWCLDGSKKIIIKYKISLVSECNLLGFEWFAKWINSTGVSMRFYWGLNGNEN